MKISNKDMTKINEYISATEVNGKLVVPELSVVILCYKAEESAKQFVEKIQSLFKRENIVSYELILVGNYLPNNNDSTPSVVKEIATNYDNVRYIAKKKQGMMGWDMKSGLALARGKYISVIDGDGQMPIEDLARVYREIIFSGADLVKTYRLKRGDSVWRKTLSIFYNFIFDLLFFSFSLKDINSKPKIFRRGAFKKLELFSDDWFIDAEIMIQAKKLGFKIIEIPTVFLGLTGRRSFVGLKTVWEFIKNLLIYRLKEFFK